MSKANPSPVTNGDTTDNGTADESHADAGDRRARRRQRIADAAPYAGRRA